MMKPKRILTLLLFSFLLCLALLPLGSIGHNWKLLIAVIVYFSVTLLVLEKAEPAKEQWLIVAILAIPPLVLLGPAHLRDMNETLFCLPSTLAHFGGIGFALFVRALKPGKLRFVVASILFGLTMLATFMGYPLWLKKLNFGTFTGKVEYALPASINGMMQNKQPLKNEDLQGKVVVLDFWHVKCGICFQKFPLLQKLYDKHGSNASLQVLAINKPLKTDSIGQAFAVLKQRNYTFPVLVPSDRNLAEAFGVKVYPTVVVVDKTGTVVFKGDIEGATEVVGNLLAN